jgi:hypothetical protein
MITYDYDYDDYDALAPCLAGLGFPAICLRRLLRRGRPERPRVG